MTRKYYIWKDPACGGKDVEWLEISGQDFLQVCREDSLKRRFVRLNPIDTDDDCYVMEATQEVYASWRKEQNAHYNCQRRSKSKKAQAKAVVMDGKQTASGQDDAVTKREWDVGIGKKYSLDAPVKDQDVATLLETIADNSIDVEEEVICRALLSQLEMGLKCLSEDEHSLIVAYYWYKLTTTELGNILGVSHVTVLRRLKKALEHLRAFF